MAAHTTWQLQLLTARCQAVRRRPPLQSWLTRHLPCTPACQHSNAAAHAGRAYSHAQPWPARAPARLRRVPGQPVPAAHPGALRCLHHASNGTGNGATPRVSWLSPHSDAVQRDYDAILVLAGGQLPDGGLPEWVTRRLDACIDIQQLQQDPGAAVDPAGGAHCPVLCLGGGTPHKPPVLAATGHVEHEATACADYLMQRGVSPTSLLKEVSSYDTVGNGYFALTIHAIPAGWRKLAVVTSEFHMPRTRAIFGHAFLLAGRTLWRDPSRFQLDFLSVVDDNIFEPEVLEARAVREARSTQAWLRTCEQLQALPDLHAWLHREHLCYAAARQGEFGVSSADDVDDKALASY